MKAPSDHLGPALQHHDRRATRHPAVQVDDVMVEQADAAARHRLANGRGLICAMDAIIRFLPVTVNVERPRAKGIVDPARKARFHWSVALRLHGDHVRGRRPAWPDCCSPNHASALELEADLADAATVADSLLAVEHEVKMATRRIDNDGSRLLGAIIIDDLTQEAWIDLLEIKGGNREGSIRQFGIDADKGGERILRRLQRLVAASTTCKAERNRRQKRSTRHFQAHARLHVSLVFPALEPGAAMAEGHGE